MPLLYRMTRDGPMGKDFHSRCDNMGPTVSIFKMDNGRRFGGYTSVSWESPTSGNYKNDTKAFLVSFDNAQQIKVNRQQYAIFCNSDYGPYFGQGNLMASQPFNREQYCLSNPGNDYYLITDVNGKSLLTANDGWFTAKEIEVFQVLPKVIPVIDSMVLKLDDKEYLMSLLGDKQLRLLYRMTMHGVMGKDFHSRCDNKGPTVTIFKTSTGRRCGGYTGLSWET